MDSSKLGDSGIAGGAAFGAGWDALRGCKRRGSVGVEFERDHGIVGGSLVLVRMIVLRS